MRMLALAVAVAALAPAPSPSQAQSRNPMRLSVTPVAYDLDVTVDYDSAQLRGTARITLRNWSAAGVTDIPLLLYRLMTIRDVRAGDGRALWYEQQVTRFEDFGRLQALAARVRLPRPLVPGDTTTIVVRWDGYLLGYAETGMRYVQDRIEPAFTILRPDALAYPTIGYASWTANRRTPWPSFSYRAAITVPDTLTVANGGRLLSRSVAGGRATFAYESFVPSSRMDFAIAPYGVIETGPVRAFYLPGDSAGAARVVRAARGALELFARWFGPLPGDHALTFLEIPDGWGSQADVTTVIQTAAAFRDTTRHGEVYHEVSHLWNPPDLDTPSPRWNEGLASFLEQVATEELQGSRVRDRRADQLLAWLRANAPRHPQWTQVPLVGYGAAQLTDLSYSVGAMFFDLLDRLVGSEAFRAIIREYVERYGTAGGTTEQLMDVIRARGGTRVEPLLRDWIYTTGWVDRIATSATIHALAAHYAAGGP